MDERKKDMLYEGRSEAFVDIDRMVNEGLAGGTVLNNESQIDETTELPEEEPPRNSSFYDE